MDVRVVHVDPQQIVLNRAYPEGSMIEAYTTEEAVNCYTKYI